jgi:putative FmdB family regulatory protein
MPIYEYRCERGHTFEVLQSMSDDPVATCEQCSAPVQRVMHPVAVHFKGSGFYTTDYGKGKNGSKPSSSEPAPKSGEKSESTSASKSESKTGSESGSGSGD